MRLSPGSSASLGDVLVLLLPLLAPANAAAVTDGLWLQPSSKWLGVDGTWSTFELAVGGPAVTVQLLPNTALSEIWAVSKNICQGVQQCITDRGGVYDQRSSKSCTSIGTWALGLTNTGWNDSNGAYGLDTVAVHNSLTGITNDANGALIASIESMDYYQGFLGLGVTQGKFNNKVVNPFISQLAETYGTIPSHSYGYTAGFFHAEPSCPGSLILGGYDPLRFVSHKTEFRLHPDTRLPRARLRGITVQAADGTSTPSAWNGSSSSLVTMSDSLMVIIDTSLPYLTLPQMVCDRFASALDLVYNDTLGVYTYRTIDQYNSFLKAKPFSFTFSLSGWDNTDDFGKPLETRGVVNVTLSSAAFAQLLRFPYRKRMAITDPSIPYFPLRRAKNVNEIVLGRVFMQEAYLVTKYDEEVFSVYQARFPIDAATNYSIESIARSPNSEYPQFVGLPKSGGPGLDAGQTAGIVVSVILVSAICAFALWYCRRRRRRRQAVKEMVLPPDSPMDELKDTESAMKADTPLSPVARMFAILQGRRRTRMAETTGGVDGGPPQPAEVGADASHERYEMPAPVAPVELAANEIHSSDEATELGTEGSQQNVSEYELERRKLHRQLQGQLPLYTGPPRSLDGAAEEQGKSQDVSTVAHYRPETGEGSSPISFPSDGNNSNSLPSLPSPVSPRDPDWLAIKMAGLPSPMTLAPQYPPGLFGRSKSNANRSLTSSPTDPSFYKQARKDAEDTAVGRSISSSSRQSGGRGSSVSDGSQSPTFQHSPIDHQEIVCLGPLPENIRLPLQNPPKTRRQQPPVPQLIGPEGRKVTASPIPEDPADARHLRIPPRLAASVPSSSPGLHTASPPRSAGDPRFNLRIDPGLTAPPTPGVRRGSADTLGSNFTVEEQEEEWKQVEFTRQQSLRIAGTPTSPSSFERFDPAAELVHVPQVPDKRYSWEEDKR
ncbi:hypothetical protein RB597_006622 [Gaeumannomyces tritici]